jgi:hypothetical protein
MTDAIYEISIEPVTIKDELVGITILSLFFGTYFAHAVLGLKVLKCLTSNQDISRNKIIAIRIIFFLQVIFQAFLFYNSVYIIERLIDLLQRRQFYLFYYQDLVIGIAAILLGIFTLYLEIFTFPLIKAARKKYRLFLDEISNIGC